MQTNSTVDREKPLPAASVLAVVEGKCVADALDPLSRIWDPVSLHLVETVIVRITADEDVGLDTVEIVGTDKMPGAGP